MERLPSCLAKKTRAPGTRRDTASKNRQDVTQEDIREGKSKEGKKDGSFTTCGIKYQQVNKNLKIF